MWQHPKLCFAFTKSGDCKKDSCEYLHPKLCKHFIKKEICEYESKCKFFHILTCRKNKEVIDENKNDNKNEADLEKEIREKVIKEIKDKEEKDKKDREEKDKAEKASQDFQQASVKGPEILTILIKCIPK